MGLPPPELQEEESIARGLDMLRENTSLKDRMMVAARMEPEYLEKLRQRAPALVEPILEALAQDPGQTCSNDSLRLWCVKPTGLKYALIV